MSLLNTNKLTWFQNNGAPLKSGYVYVGQAGLDPQVPANQKTVTFTDSQGNEFPATQPLRTDTNGRIQWNGKAITATVSGDYSLLLLDSNQTQIDDGWIPTINGPSDNTDDLVDYREYKLTLADIKQIDVTVGQTIGNVGKITADDGLGADWLVVSPTGGAADDISLIDFDNGTQGRRVDSAAKEISGYTSSSAYYILEDGIDEASNGFDIDANLSYNGAYETIGPTGSGATNIWTAMDDIPTSAKYLEVYTYVSGNAASTNVSISLQLRKSGSSISGTVLLPSLTVTAGDQTILLSGVSGMAKIPLDSSNTFECAFGGSIGFTPSASLKIVGFGV